MRMDKSSVSRKSKANTLIINAMKKGLKTLNNNLWEAFCCIFSWFISKLIFLSIDLSVYQSVDLSIHSSFHPRIYAFSNVFESTIAPGLTYASASLHFFLKTSGLAIISVSTPNAATEMTFHLTLINRTHSSKHMDRLELLNTWEREKYTLKMWRKYKKYGRMGRFCTFLHLYKLKTY